jgi:outer membrane protein assembly factor BamB
MGLWWSVKSPALDWPEFRGPDGQGHSPARNLPVTWGPHQNVAWRAAIPGQGWSSPVLAGDRIYLTTALREETGGDEGISLAAMALDAGSGRTVWTTKVFHPETAVASRMHRKNSPASPTPLVEGDRLYVHFGHQGTACLDLEGNVRWRNTELGYRPVHGSGGSPILAGDLLIFSCDGAEDPFLAALEKSTGRLRWKVPRETNAKKKFSFSTPLLVTVAGRAQVISPGSDMVGAYDPESGKEIWRVRYDGYSVVPRPVFGQGLIFISTGFDRPKVLAIRPEGAAGDVTESHVAWTAARGAPNTPSMLLVGAELYTVSDAGVASCFEAKTGRLRWQERVGGDYSASPVYADGKIYLLSEEGKGVVLEPGLAFRKLAENRLEERTLASCAVGDGALFIRTESHLYRIQNY